MFLTQPQFAHMSVTRLRMILVGLQAERREPNFAWHLEINARSPGPEPWSSVGKTSTIARRIVTGWAQLWGLPFPRDGRKESPTLEFHVAQPSHRLSWIGCYVHSSRQVAIEMRPLAQAGRGCTCLCGGLQGRRPQSHLGGILGSKRQNIPGLVVKALNPNT